MPADSEIVAYRDEVTLPHPTVRHIKCELLVQSGNLTKRCKSCSEHRHSLRSMLSQKKPGTSSRTDTTSHVNYRYLTDQEKTVRLHHLHEQVRAASRKVEKLTKRLGEISDIQGSTLDQESHLGMKNIMRENAKGIADKHPSGTFARVFWEQQMKASSLCDARQMRWHPAMIKWCLYLRHRSVHGIISNLVSMDALVLLQKLI